MVILLLPLIIIIIIMLLKRTGTVGNQRTNGDHRDSSIVEIGQNTQHSLGDLRRLAVMSLKIL